jgi:hypothetical protein
MGSCLSSETRPPPGGPATHSEPRGGPAAGGGAPGGAPARPPAPEGAAPPPPPAPHAARAPAPPAPAGAPAPPGPPARLEFEAVDRPRRKSAPPGGCCLEAFAGGIAAARRGRLPFEDQVTELCRVLFQVRRRGRGRAGT